MVLPKPKEEPGVPINSIFLETQVHSKTLTLEGKGNQPLQTVSALRIKSYSLLFVYLAHFLGTDTDAILISFTQLQIPI